MKNIVFLFILTKFLALNAQKTITKKGPILKDFGKVYQLEKPELVLDKDTVYKVIFDVYTDRSNGEKLNPLLNTVARYLNMHAQQGVPIENMKVVVIIHGAATKNVLHATAYLKQFKKENPNTALLHALKNVNVKLFVCGQSYLANGFDSKDKSPDVKMALSALTVLVKFQHEGYQLITFN